MQMRAAVLLALVGPTLAVMLTGAPADTHAVANTSGLGPTTTKSVTASDVVRLHQKLEVLSRSLEGLVQHGSLSNTKISPVLQSFVAELRVTLNATASPKDIPAAMQRLRNAQAGIADITKALSAQQEALMHEDATEETNLLLGVLMTRKGEPMKKQLEVLKSGDFSSLPVSKALLAKHNDSMPLFQQVALFMDAHGAASGASSPTEKAQKLAKTVAFFKKQMNTLEHQEQVMQELHERRTAKLDELIKKSDKATARSLLIEKKHADRENKKRSLVHKQQSKLMSDIIAALERGDSKALKTAQHALQKQLDALQARSGDFLHLLQLGHRLASRDCPFCVAQCIGKCHDAGRSYAECMPECAKAGQ